MRPLFGLQSPLAFLSSPRFHYLCSCCSIICQPTRTQRCNQHLQFEALCSYIWSCVWLAILAHWCHICVLFTGAEVSCRCYSHGPMLCGRVGKVLCYVFFIILQSQCRMRQFFFYSGSNILWLLFQYISLVNPSISVDIEILRDGYEAFAMYCFGRYLVACLGTPFSTNFHSNCYYHYISPYM